MSYKTAIRNALVERAAAGTFPTAVYTEARPSLMSEGDPVAPAGVEANEVRAAFAVDGRYGRSYRQERTGWAWVLKVRFEQEVSLETFEAAWLADPPTIARDPSDGRDVEVTLLLEDVAYEHPPRGGASNGTEVAWRVLADLCPL